MSVNSVVANLNTTSPTSVRIKQMMDILRPMYVTISRAKASAREVTCKIMIAFCNFDSYIIYNVHVCMHVYIPVLELH